MFICITSFLISPGKSAAKGKIIIKVCIHLYAYCLLSWRLSLVHFFSISSANSKVRSHIKWSWIRYFFLFFINNISEFKHKPFQNSAFPTSFDNLHQLWEFAHIDLTIDLESFQCSWFVAFAHLGIRFSCSFFITVVI